MKLTVRHETVYTYPRTVVNSVNEVWLRPLSDERQTCLNFVLTVDPPAHPSPYTDYFGNTVYHFDIGDPHSRLGITAEAEVETCGIDFAARLDGDGSAYAPLRGDDADLWLDFLAETPLTAAGPAVRVLAAAASAGDSPSTAAVVQRLSEIITNAFRYEQGATKVDTQAEAALTSGIGVCQDYTHVFLSACRVLQIPARYVSGYLCTGSADNPGQRSHAWPEILLPNAGWIELDPTNGCLVDERYVRVAIGRDYTDVPPVRGAYAGPSGNGLDVSVYVDAAQQQQ